MGREEWRLGGIAICDVNSNQGLLKLALFLNFFIAEGGGIVWEFLVLRSGACVHKGGVGAFASPQS